MDVVSNGETAHFSGLQTCASLWACPVCSARIREGRADEIEIGLAEHFRQGGHALFLTLTMPHDFGDRLGRLMDVLGAGYRSLLAGQAFQDDKREFGIVGSIRSTEVTHGDSGWHPHVHVLVLTDRELSDDDVRKLRVRFWRRWESFVTGRGFRAPTFTNGCTLDRVRSAGDVAAYTAKVQDGWDVGRELTRHDLKSARRHGRTPFAIAADALKPREVEGIVLDPRKAARDLALWREYEVATKGRHAIQWSRGLRARLAVDVVPDAVLAADDQAGEVIANMPGATWRALDKLALTERVLDLAAALDVRGVLVLIDLAAQHADLWAAERARRYRT